MGVLPPQAAPAAQPPGLLARDALTTQANAQQGNQTGPALGGGLIRAALQRSQSPPVATPPAQQPGPQQRLPNQGRPRMMPSPQHLAIAQHLTNAYRQAQPAPAQGLQRMVAPTMPTMSVPTAPRY